MITFAESLQFNYSDFCRTTAADIAGLPPGFLSDAQRLIALTCHTLTLLYITLPHRQQSVIARFVYWLE